MYFENAGGVSFEPVKYVWVDDTFVEFTPDDLYIQILETGYDQYATVYSTEPVATTADSPPEHFYYVADQVGQPVQVAAADGTLAWEATHSPFGEKSTISIGTDFHQPLRFPGQYLDEETSLHYNWNRYYDPAMGMYTQVDRITTITNGEEFANAQQNPEILQVYSYSIGNPLQYIDWNGLIPRSKDFWKAYIDYMNYRWSDDAWNKIGEGAIKDLFGERDSCAARISHGLNFGGEEIPAGAPGANRNLRGNEKYYIVSTYSLDKYLREKWGAPIKIQNDGDRMDVEKRLKDGQVAVFVDPASPGRSGHAAIIKKGYSDPYISGRKGAAWILPE